MSIDWARNVGTNESPVSYLHERAVALLYDELKTNDEVRVRLADGMLSHNIREGMVELKVPGEWDQVGGVVPDLIMYGVDKTPIRIVEVIVTSPPTKYKRGQLRNLVKRGVDVVEVVVRDPKDLLTLCWTPSTPYYSSRSYTELFSVNRARQELTSGRKERLERVVNDLTATIQGCSPKARRELYATLRGLGCLDSLFPVRPDNPKAEMLKGEWEDA